jgi:hypothetical protein
MVNVTHRHDPQNKQTFQPTTNPKKHKSSKTNSKHLTKQVHELGPMSALEKEALEKAVPDLIAQVRGWFGLLKKK